MMSNDEGMSSKQNVNKITEAVPWGPELPSGGGGGGGPENFVPMGSSFDFPKPASYLGNWSYLPDFHPYYSAELPINNPGNNIECSNNERINEDLKKSKEHLAVANNKIYAAVQYQTVINMHIQPEVPPPFWPNFPGLFTLDRRELQSVSNIVKPLEESTRKQRNKRLRTNDALKIGCNCKKTACLKLYCECFKTDTYCAKETCGCDGCFNTKEYEDTVEIAREQHLSHKSLAVESKSDDLQDMNNKTDKSVSVRSEKGCKCSKSKCVNKYCECYKADKGCRKECGCENCKNYNGVKPGNESAHLPDSAEAFHPHQNDVADLI